jgi:hypothetical protein
MDDDMKDQIGSVSYPKVMGSEGDGSDLFKTMMKRQKKPKHELTPNIRPGLTGLKFKFPQLKFR